MAKRFMDFDPLTGFTTYHDYDESTDTTYIHREQDVSSIIEANKILQNDAGYSANGMKKEWWHYATVPNVIIEKWKNELGVDAFNKDHQKKVFSLINQPEYRYLKTTTKMDRGLT